LSSDEESIGDVDYTQSEHVPGVSNSGSDENECVSDVPIHSLWSWKLVDSNCSPTKFPLLVSMGLCAL
jgi:hypothetical protein